MDQNNNNNNNNNNQMPRDEGVTNFWSAMSVGLGAFGIVFGFVPVAAFFAAIGSVLGFVFGVIGRKRAKEDRVESAALIGLVGIILCIIGIAFSIGGIACTISACACAACAIA